MKPNAILLAAIFLLLTMTAGCGSDTDGSSADKEPGAFSFMSIGSFSVERIEENWTEVRDGAGRTLVLIPREAPVPDGYAPHQVVRVPARRVIAYASFDVAVLKAIGVLEEVLVGVTKPKEVWTVPEVIRGMEQGKIAYLGNASAVDYERVRQQNPDLVLTYDASVIPMLDEMEVPCVITSTPVAMCLSTRMKFVNFIAPFFHREKEAKAFFNRVSASLERIREKTKDAGPEPKVMWGDIYEKRVLVEPGNAWAGELIALAQSDYLFNDVYGKSCIEISLERFLYSGEDADILFTYKTPKTGATSKAALARANPMLAGVRPLNDGKVYSPVAEYSQSADKLDVILTDIAAILHPEVYTDHRLRFFLQLPDTDPERKM